ncbi:hypothetical protein XELAEV_18034995mg [Xenopus laevis]|uniref:Uncharacterized protein n=1 Tax=Xenopus laevis TaxID=8355 RepID=A0A974CF53_XENLA|nr:hypothetical protein XELAEV_18034995mg [Xenopus laevis]
MTLDRIHATFPNVPERCWRCHGRNSSLIHIWRSCSLAQNFWSPAQLIIESLTNLLLGLLTIQLKKNLKQIFFQVLFSIRTLLARNWRNSTLPTKKEILEETNRIQLYESIFTKLK